MTKKVNQITYPEVLAILEPWGELPLTEWLLAYGEKMAEPIKPWQARDLTSYLTGGAKWCRRGKKILVRWLVRWGLSGEAVEVVLASHQEHRPDQGEVVYEVAFQICETGWEWEVYTVVASSPSRAIDAATAYHGSTYYRFSKILGTNCREVGRLIDLIKEGGVLAADIREGFNRHER